MRLALVAIAVLLLNLPFGYWRAGTRRFSWPWMLAIHLPVPVIVAIRVLSGTGFQLSSFPVIIAAFFTGQYLGGQAQHYFHRGSP